MKDNKLFAVDMPEDALCDCGANAETQFVIASSKKKANQQAKEAQKARDAGGNSPNVACGECIARKIVDQGLIIAELMKVKHTEIKLMRVTFDVKCCAEGCGKPLPFGTWAHFHQDSGLAICVECGAKRGWTDKARATSSVKMLELKEDIKALRKRYRVEAEGLYLLEEKVDLHQVAENYIELERQITGAIAKLESYLNSVATPQEKVILQSLEKEIHELQDIALEIKKEFDARLFLLDKAERQRKMVQKIFADSDAEREAEAERQAEEAEVQSQ